MTGMHRNSGTRLDSLAHLRQAIADILTTPLGSRLQRRTYGSLIPDLIDQPANDATRLRMYAATASALMRWEPRLRITRVQLVHGDQPGQMVLMLDGEYLPTGTRLSGLSAALAFRGGAA